MSTNAVSVVVPASSANLGPGFDCLALGVTLYLRAKAIRTPGEKTRIVQSGRPEATSESPNAILKAMETISQRLNRPLPPVRVEVRSDIPSSSGLGSSAAAIVAGGKLALALLEEREDSETLLKSSIASEGHPDNVAAAIYGGLVIASHTEGKPHILRIPITHPLTILAVRPLIRIRTEETRATLPRTVSLEDAVFNVANAARIVLALASGNLKGMAPFFADRLHQPHRAGAIPYLYPCLKAAQEAGAWGAFLSGSGPTIVALCDKEEAAQIGGSILVPLQAHGHEADVFHLSVDNEGARYEE